MGTEGPIVVLDTLASLGVVMNSFGGEVPLRDLRIFKSTRPPRKSTKQQYDCKYALRKLGGILIEEVLTDASPRAN